jgi:hypothetical protein
MNEQPHTLHLPRMVEAFEHAAGSVAAATPGLIPPLQIHQASSAPDEKPDKRKPRR